MYKLHRFSKFIKRFSSTSPRIIYEKLSHRTLIEISGSDASSLLQGVITNDITTLNQHPFGCIYTMFLNNKGRVLYDGLIYKFQDTDDYLLEVDKNISTEICKHLVIFKLRKNCNVRNVDKDYEVWVKFNADEIPQNGTSPLEVINDSLFEFPTDEASLYFNDPRLSALGNRIITSTHKASHYLSQFEPILYKNLRYRLGIAEGADELPIGKCFPMEANCDYLNGVSFNKGCYLGQELTARSYHTGVIRKRYMPLYVKFSETQNQIKFDDIVKIDNTISAGKVRGFDQKTGLGIGLLRLENVTNKQNLNINDLSVGTVVPFWWPYFATPEKKTESKDVKEQTNKANEKELKSETQRTDKLP